METSFGSTRPPTSIAFTIVILLVLAPAVCPSAVEAGLRAGQLRDQAMAEMNGPRRLDLLEEAAALDPDDARTWLALAESNTAMGYAERTETALERAKSLIQETEGEERNGLVREYALQRAWFEYERGDFREGEKWAELAVKAKAGLSGYLILGLNRAPLVRSEADVMEFVGVFRPFDSNTNRARNTDWIYRMWMHFNNFDWIPPDVLGYQDQSVKIAEHEMTRSRDRGLLFEVNGEGKLAIREYAKFLPYHPCPDGGWLSRREAVTPGSDPGFPAMPFWVNPEGEYVTGSLLACEAYAYDMMTRAEDPEERGAWASRVVRVGARALARYPTRPWVRMWRGAAYLALEMMKEAEEEITMARAWFDELEIAEPGLDILQGRILLLEKNYRAALPVLERAAASYPDDGSVWADLGVARAMLVGGGPAREALDRALELDPALGSAWHNRGLLNLREGRYEEAAADLDRAVALLPEDERIRKDIAQVQQKLRLLRE